MDKTVGFPLLTAAVELEFYFEFMYSVPDSSQCHERVAILLEWGARLVWDISALLHGAEYGDRYRLGHRRVGLPFPTGLAQCTVRP